MYFFLIKLQICSYFFCILDDLIISDINKLRNSHKEMYVMFYKVNLGNTMPVYNKKSTDSSKLSAFNATGKQQNFDTIDFASKLSEEQARTKDVVGSISQKAHIRPTFQELDNLKNLVDSGEYKPDSKEIASRMLMMIV